MAIDSMECLRNLYVAWAREIEERSRLELAYPAPHPLELHERDLARVDIIPNMAKKWGVSESTMRSFIKFQKRIHREATAEGEVNPWALAGELMIPGSEASHFVDFFYGRVRAFRDAVSVREQIICFSDTARESM